MMYGNVCMSEINCWKQDLPLPSSLPPPYYPHPSLHPLALPSDNHENT